MPPLSNPILNQLYPHHKSDDPFINKKKAIQVGDSAYNAMKRDKLKTMKGMDFKSNAFIEFKRTMGTDKKYNSSNLDKNLSSEELSSEVLKTLKSYISDESFKCGQVGPQRSGGIVLLDSQTTWG